MDLNEPEELEDTAPGPTNVVPPCDSTELTQQELHCHRELVRKLRACPHCPHPAGTLCLKTQGDAHVAFTSALVKGWAKALAS